MEIMSYLMFICGLLTWQFFITVRGLDGCTNRTEKIKWNNTPDDYKLYRGEWLEVDCRVKNYPINVTARLGQNNLFDVRVADGRKLKREGNVFNLTNITSSDIGNYYCEVCNQKILMRELDIIRVQFGNAFSSPTIKNKPNGPVEFGASFTMDCEVYRYYTLSWLKDGIKLGRQKGDFSKKGSYTRLRYSIRNFDQSYEGRYTCRAERSVVNWGSEDNVHIKMLVRTKPFFLNFPQQRITLRAGKEFTLEIIAKGTPHPNVYCWKTTKDNMQLTEFKMMQTFWIEIKDNEATFNCNATNVMGSTVKNFSLNVLTKPKIDKPHSGILSFLLERSKALNLSCKLKAKANPPAQIQFYKTTLKWNPFANNEKNKVVSSHFISADGIKGKFLILKSQTETKVFYTCVASNSRGETDRFTWLVQRAIAAKGNNISVYVVAIIVVSVIIAFFLLLIIVVLYKRKKLYGGFYIFTLPPARDYIKTLDQNKSLQEQSHKLPYFPEWEFPMDNISLMNELGSGAFGVVYLANAIGISSFHPRIALSEKKTQRRFSFSRLQRRNVYILDKIVKQTAVKTLKENYDQAELADIQSELKIMIHVGEHENILNILGACTKGNDKPLIILEYCPYGNLKDFLRSRRDIYNPEWKEIDHHTQLSVTDLVKFAFQISKGMEFLISRKCIHRDLASRNVLVGEGYVAKISDFGLARDVYESLEYVKQTTGLLPLKWMAIEAIQDKIFNEKTDVWSFGILLWEIFTLGGTPYPKLHPSELFESLLNGNRMSPPVYCPQQMADMMTSCWFENPDERPPFSSIAVMFEEICGTNTENMGEYQNLRSDVADNDSSKGVSELLIGPSLKE